MDRTAHYGQSTKTRTTCSKKHGQDCGLRGTKYKNTEQDIKLGLGI